jgi:hypothetical protein
MSSRCRIVAPGKNGALDPPARGLFALRLGREADFESALFGQPPAVPESLVEVDSNDRLIRRIEIGRVEIRRGFFSGREEEAAKVGVRHRRLSHLELRDQDAVNRLLVLPYAGASHEELAFGNENALERLFRT